MQTKQVFCPLFMVGIILIKFQKVRPHQVLQQITNCWNCCTDGERAHCSCWTEPSSFFHARWCRQILNRFLWEIEFSVQKEAFDWSIPISTVKGLYLFSLLALFCDMFVSWVRLNTLPMMSVFDHTHTLKAYTWAAIFLPQSFSCMIDQINIWMRRLQDSSRSNTKAKISDFRFYY